MEKMTPLKFYIILFIAFIVMVFIGGWIAYNAVSDGLPSLTQLENPKQDYATQVFSADGELLDHYYKFRRVSLPFDSIPPYFIKALIATEDRKFYDHWGVHLFRIFKAMVKNVFAGRIKEGASTITMQLSRNLFFTHESTLKRKIREAVTAIAIEKTYTKNEILAMYANTVAFGRGTYGIKVAANVYFDKEPSELTLSECAFLVGLLKAPEHYNAIDDYERAIQRRNLLLGLIYKQGMIDRFELTSALDEPITLSKSTINPRGRSYLAPHFVEMIRQNLKQDSRLDGYDIYRDGLIIYTTLNARIQKYAQEALEEHLSKYQKIFNRSFSWRRHRKLLNKLVTKAIHSNYEYISADKNKKKAVEKKLRADKAFVDSVKNAATTIQAGLIVIDPSNGQILALVGASPKFMQENRSAKYSLNHVTQIKRQPGSSFKPFVYVTALIDGMQPNDTIECGPFTYELPNGELWSPSGTGGCGPGETVTVAEALARSINTVAARIITEKTTPDRVRQIAVKMGIRSSLQAVPALALGAGGDVSPYEMTSAFGTFANEGIYLQPYSVKRIEDRFGNIVFENRRSPKAYNAIPQKYSHIMTLLLKGVINHGTGYTVRKYFTGVDACGKTGTTNDYADAWFIGYTPQLVAGLWIGFDDRRITFTGGYGYASKAAAPVWGKLMNKIYSDPSLPYKQKRFSFFSDSTNTIEEYLRQDSLKNSDNIVYE
jgi:penicillin-binding protein 1A